MDRSLFKNPALGADQLGFVDGLTNLQQPDAAAEEDQDEQEAQPFPERLSL